MTNATQDASMSVGVEDMMKFAALECTQKAMRRVCDVKGKSDGSHTTRPYTSRLRDNGRNHRIQVLV